MALASITSLDFTTTYESNHTLSFGAFLVEEFLQLLQTLQNFEKVSNVLVPVLNLIVIRVFSFFHCDPPQTPLQPNNLVFCTSLAKRIVPDASVGEQFLPNIFLYQ